MVRSLKSKVIAIPFAGTSVGSEIAKLVAAEQGELILGAPTAAQLKTVDAAIPQSHNAYAVQVDLDRPKSVDEFFKIAIGQFGHVDTIVVETMKTASRSTLTEKAASVHDGCCIVLTRRFDIRSATCTSSTSRRWRAVLQFPSRRPSSGRN